MSRVFPIVPVSEPELVPTSLCDHCVKPGHCCRDMVISGSFPHRYGTFYADGWPKSGLDWLERAMPGHPFIPLRLEVIEPGDTRHDPTADEGRPYGFGHWACKNLGADGRCTDYENRPALCRAYQPASDGLCVMYMERP